MRHTNTWPWSEPHTTCLPSGEKLARIWALRLTSPLYLQHCWYSVVLYSLSLESLLVISTCTPENVSYDVASALATGVRFGCCGPLSYRRACTQCRIFFCFAPWQCRRPAGLRTPGPCSGHCRSGTFQPWCLQQPAHRAAARSA